MRITHLAVTGIGPFRHRQELDFERLNAAGLFLVDGPTGAGKSSLIDSMVFALFGGVSGAHSDVGRIRSDHCTPDEPSEVVLEFTVQGRRHRIMRRPAYQRPKKKGEGTTEEKAVQVLEEFDAVDDVVVTLTSADEIGRHVRDLLGMSAEQFRQMVVLPQGEFDALLRMRPLERLDALAHLLGTRFYERLQAQLASQAALGREELAAANAAVSAVVARLEGATLSGILVVDDPWAVVREERADDVERTSALAEVIATVRDHAVRAGAEATVAREQAAALADHATVARRRLEGMDRLDSARAAIAAAGQNLDPADRDVLALDGSDITARTGVLRQLLGSWEDDARWEAEQDERDDARTLLVGRVRAAETEVAAIHERAAALPGLRSDLSTSLEAARQAGDECRRLEAEQAQAAELLDVLERCTDAEAELVTRQGVSVRARATTDQVRVELEDLRRALDALHAEQIAQSASLLAGVLQDGCACPVCGATDHPAPAVVAAGVEIVSPAQIDEVQAAITQALERQVTADDGLKVALALEDSARAERDRLAGAAGDADRQTLAAEAQERGLRISQLRLAREGEPLLREQLLALESEAGLIADLAHAAVAEQAQAGLLLDQHDQGEQDRRQSIDERLITLRPSSGPASNALATASEAVTWLRARVTAVEVFAQADQAVRLAEAQVDAAGLQREDAYSAWQVAQNDSDAMATKADELHGRATLLASMVDSLVMLAGEFEQALDERRRRASGLAPVISLADIATAQRGSANIRRVSLESYAVQRRFASVLEAASIHLDRMSAGKYELVLEDSARGNQQAGLGIAVIDAWTGRRRDPRTLSGGESFYVSLALALGLADVVRDESGGVPIETLFVDEGFGSLDQDTLNLVLEQLDHLRSGGRVVGVVSHVTEMKEWVSDRIAVSVGIDRSSSAKVLPDL